MNKNQYVGFYNTPPIWNKEQFEINQFEFPDLNLDLFQPTDYPSNIRLGHQMEYVFKQLVEYSEQYDVVMHNLPISRNKITLGEIDFILHDKVRDKLVHIELTCKFYIIDPSISEPIQRLIGPNRRDSFLLKMGKIKNVQFPLLHSEEGVKALESVNIDHSEIEHQCCFKAQVFHPFKNDSIDIGPLNRDCIAGYWLRRDDVDNDEFRYAQYYLPTKSEWVIEPNDHVPWKSHADIMDEVNQILGQERVPMVWMKSDDGKFEKFFIVWW